MHAVLRHVQNHGAMMTCTLIERPSTSLEHALINLYTLVYIIFQFTLDCII